MDAIPPATAGPASRPSSSGSRLLSRVAVIVASLAVAVLAGAACVLSFDDLRALALQGQADPEFAYLYPAGFDALLVVALLAVPVVRPGRLVIRLQAALILILLLVAAAAADVAMASGVVLAVRPAAVVVALVPWIMLVVALWLLLLIVRYAQTKSADLDDDSDDDVVPFTRTAHVTVPPDYTPPTPVSPVTETVAPPELAPPLTPSPPPRPARWGDLIRPNAGDVLVHPLPEPDDETDKKYGEAAAQAAEKLSRREEPDEANVDTQPMRNLPADPDPEHGPEAADPEEFEAATWREPYDDEVTAPPSGHLRSTPTPPSDS
ncbi:DUF2637 domain-containing protein [Herbidospora sp. NEAU-GS84]|uniref:DUF2637 domain-containing protein n=1 Tax=Herbidospora solisilvae TaxID=2696284 RepID=A0A7C9N3K2_9ACTN|nr:DUF2637 domain-containing protein [Herbidospora solisilvae]NAS25430.1 DUF2637 domain-containing protein [Herbidospora solisilvae]